MNHKEKGFKIPFFIVHKILHSFCTLSLDKHLISWSKLYVYMHLKIPDTLWARCRSCGMPILDISCKSRLALAWALVSCLKLFDSCTSDLHQHLYLPTI